MFKFLERAIGLLEGVAAHGFDVISEEVGVFEGDSLALGPLDLEAEDAGAFGEDVAFELVEVDVGGIELLRLLPLLVAVAHVVPAAEELLLLVGGGDDDGGGSWLVADIPTISSGGINEKSGGLESTVNCMTPAGTPSMSKLSMIWSFSGLSGEPM